MLKGSEFTSLAYIRVWGDDDSARMIYAFHTVLAAIDCNVWLEYVQSGANISDLPSRGKFELLAGMGSLEFERILQPVGGDWWRVYTSLFMKLAPRPSAGAKRSRAPRWNRSSNPSRLGV